MKTIANRTFDEERVLYDSRDIVVRGCVFDGPSDGESALKECGNIIVEHCFFNLRYPFWHDRGLKLADSEMTELCRAALWYSEHVEVRDSKLHGIKALRECADIKIQGCDIVSAEFGWSVRGITMEDSTVQSEYFMMRSERLNFRDVRMKGKYSFQYITDSVFENCVFDTKDAFWHAKNIVVRNSVVKGEYLAWYSENVTFENCRIIGTQPLCYCKNLKLIDCEMTDTDLSFERSEVEATLTAPIVSIKNPLSGHIHVPAVGNSLWILRTRTIRSSWKSKPAAKMCSTVVHREQEERISMKVKFWKIFSCAAVTMLFLTGCADGSLSETNLQGGSDGSLADGVMSSDFSDDLDSSDTRRENTEQSDTDFGTEENTVKKMTLQIGDSSFTATLEDNAAVDVFAEMMRKAPVIVQMSDYSGFEKVGPLGTSLPVDDSQTTTQAGDIVLYNGNQIVIFYGSNSWSYTKLGKIDDLSGWEDALGSGDVTVVFSLE